LLAPPIRGSCFYIITLSIETGEDVLGRDDEGGKVEVEIELDAFISIDSAKMEQRSSQ